MATSDRRSTSSLIERLQAEPWEFGFFQAVRILHLHLLEESSEQSGQLRAVGVGDSPRVEGVRFGSELSLSYTSSELAEIEVKQAGARQVFELVTTFIGLTGANGVLPRHYTQRLLDQQREYPESLVNGRGPTHCFFDLFHHRIVSLFYRAWERSRFQFRWERRKRETDGDVEDLFTQTLFAFVGLGNNLQREAGEGSRVGVASSSARDHLLAGDEVKLFYSGLFSHRPRNACSLQLLIEDFFGLKCQVHQFCGAWLSLKQRDQTSLGSRTSSSQLGMGAVAGDRVWSVESRLRITIGPLSRHEFDRFVPGQGDFVRLSELARAYVGPEFDIELQPVLSGSQVRSTQLHTKPGKGARLGWTSWLSEGPLPQDADDAVFEISGIN